jgi:hypothetical protein
MNERLKVVFCTDGVFPHVVGGMQKHSKLLIEEIARMNVVDLVVIHPHHNTKVFAPELNIKEHGINRGKKYWSYLYNEYNYVAAFAVASLLALLALVTLGLKSLVERQTHRQRIESQVMEKAS